MDFIIFALSMSEASLSLARRAKIFSEVKWGTEANKQTLMKVTLPKNLYISSN